VIKIGFFDKINYSMIVLYPSHSPAINVLSVMSLY